MSELAATLEAVWDRLTAGVTDRNAPARYPVLATTGNNGPEARMLVLRGADREAGTVTLFTDAATGKVTQIATDPRVALLIWDAAAEVQIRLRGLATTRPGTPTEWAALGERPRTAYGGDPPPGQPITHPDAHLRVPDPSRFTVLTARIDEIETLALGLPHQRALFRRDDGFQGQWLAP